MLLCGIRQCFSFFWLIFLLLLSILLNIG